MGVDGKSATGTRRDAQANQQRLLDVASDLLRSDPDVTLDEIAAAAAISRATIYRRFKTRRALIEAVHEQDVARGDANVTDELRPAGQLASSGPVPLDIPDVLNKVPPFLLGDQIVAEAQRLAGVRSVAVYLVDIDGTRLLWLAGSREFPLEFPLELAVGPEIPREGIPVLRTRLAESMPAAMVAPMFLRGRAIGILVALDAPEAPLLELARQAGAALALAEEYTDVFDAGRRRKDITAASEIQQNMLPPRIARISGGLLAGNVLPGYEIGGDWFDYVENPDGAWIAVADSYGKGTTAAAIGAITLGAFRAKRRRQASLGDTVRYMEETLLELQAPNAFCNAIVARWHGPTSSFFWISCGDEQPYLVSESGDVTPMDGQTHPSLGRLSDGASRTVEADGQRLASNERVLLISDGVLSRRARDGTALGLDAVRSVVQRLDVLSAPALVHALEKHIGQASDDPLEDDATIVAFAPTTS